MNKVILVCILACVLCVAKASAQRKYLLKSSGSRYELSAAPQTNDYEPQYKPHPYNFGYNIKDEHGHSQWHKEEGDEHNVKKGSYGYTDAHGLYRHVNYIADHQGFRVTIKTNEPGTANAHPADVRMHAETPPKYLYTYKHHEIEPQVNQKSIEQDEQYTYVPVYSPKEK